MDKKNKSMVEKLREHLNSLSSEQIEELNEQFLSDEIPKGWLSIEDHLPMMKAEDVMEFYSEYKVRFKDGTESITTVTDHNIWYHYAKEVGITHWYND